MLIMLFITAEGSKAQFVQVNEIAVVIFAVGLQ